MQTNLSSAMQGTSDGEEAAALLRECVHCGFCSAVCPTYQLLGDELDGPRGRIYLIKQMLEGVEPTARTQLHLDRCLTCRACETACPSGVQYGRLLGIGRELVAQRVARPAAMRLLRASLSAVLTGDLFAPLLKLARALLPLLPVALKRKLSQPHSLRAAPRRTHVRKMLLLGGCVQPSLAPNINAATVGVFDALGIELLVVPSAGCCGAIRHHLDDQRGALKEARRNIDAWWPYLEGGCAEAIVANASACGAMVQDYPYLLRHDSAYAAKARRVAAATRDVAQLPPEKIAQLKQKIAVGKAERIVFHAPCTLQHAQHLSGVVEGLLIQLGVDLLPSSSGLACCGSAGTYSLLQPELAKTLRDRKLAALLISGPQLILSANLGCIAHLAGAAPIPVRHWIEWLDARLAADSRR